LEAGLALTLVEAPFEMQKRAELRGPPSFMADHCKALGLPTTGNAAGNSNLDDLTGLRVGQCYFAVATVTIG
jgi:iron transport multicopper oxidase